LTGPGQDREKTASNFVFYFSIVALAATLGAAVTLNKCSSCPSCPSSNRLHRAKTDGLSIEELNVPSLSSSWNAIDSNPSIFNEKDPPDNGRDILRDYNFQSYQTSDLSTIAAATKRPEIHPSVCKGSREHAGPQCHRNTSTKESSHSKQFRDTPKQSTFLNSDVGEESGTWNHERIHGHSLVDAPGAQDSSSPRRTGPGETIGSPDFRQASPTDYTIRVPPSVGQSTSSSKVDFHYDASLGLPTHGFAKGREVSTLSSRNSDASVGKFQKRPLRRTGSGEVHCHSTPVPATPPETRVGYLPRSIPRAEENKLDFKCTLHSSNCSYSSGGGRLLKCRDSHTHRSHSHVRPPPSGTEVHRSQSQSTRVTVTNQDVSNTGSNLRTAVDSDKFSFSDTEKCIANSKLLPHFMVSSHLNISNVPKGLLEKTSEALRLDDLLQIVALPFTKEELLFLRSSEPDPEVNVYTVMESSGKRKKIKFSVDGDFCQIKPPRGPCNLPLAPITKKRIDYNKLLSLPVPPSPELVDVLSWIRTDRLKRHVEAHPLFWESKNATSHHVSRHLAGDMPYLHDIKVFKKGSWSYSTIEIPVFKVPKSDHTSSRLIGDARGVNKLLPTLGQMGLPDLPSLIRQLLQYRVLYQLDARSYFYAFGMSKDASDVFGVRWGNRRGRFTTSHWDVMLQGFSLAPHIAQHSSLHLSKNTIHDMEDVMLAPWVDNFLFGTMNNQDMEKLITRFNCICSEVNVELKPPELPPGTTMDALGLHFDVSASDVNYHFVELQPAFRESMVEDDAFIGALMTPRQYFQVFGACMWANYAVARQPLCRWGHALATLREMAIMIQKSGSRETWDEPVSVSSEAVADLRNMSLFLRNARMYYRNIQEVPTSVDLFTDASNWAWGYLKTTPRLAGQHRPHAIQDIFVAELLAACDAWNTFSSEVPNLHVDNTAAVGALLKGHSSSGRGNLILSRLYEYLPQGARARITTVPTDCQRADLLSRGVIAAGPPCGHHHVSKPVGWVKEKEGGGGFSFLFRH